MDDIDIIDELKLLNRFVDPRPGMTISRAIDKIDALRELVKKLDEYIAFLDKANAGPISNAFVHGWRCPQKDIETGDRLRKEIEALRI